MIQSGWGACKHYYSDLFQRGMAYLMALTGNTGGKPGSGIKVSTWWPMPGFVLSSTFGPRLADRATGTDADRPGPDAGRVEDDVRHDGRRPCGPRRSSPGSTPTTPSCAKVAGKDAYADPALTRPVADYMQEIFDNEWMPIYPRAPQEAQVLLLLGSQPAASLAERQDDPRQPLEGASRRSSPPTSGCPPRACGPTTSSRRAATTRSRASSTCSPTSPRWWWVTGRCPSCTSRSTSGTSCSCWAARCRSVPWRAAIEGFTDANGRVPPDRQPLRRDDRRRSLRRGSRGRAQGARLHHAVLPDHPGHGPRRAAVAEGRRRRDGEDRGDQAHRPGHRPVHDDERLRLQRAR